VALKNAGFEFLLASPPEYNGLVAEIYCDGRFVALINQERGPGLFELEMPGPDVAESEVLRRIDLHGFLATIQEACARLSQTH
jgi:hypothetical protein